ncbi:MAG: alkaline phosphatase family protein [Acidobacteriota bacterium]
MTVDQTVPERVEHSDAGDLLRSAVVAGFLGGALCGLWIGKLTLDLNPAFDGKVVDRLMLSLWLAALYAAAGALSGLVMGATTAALGTLSHKISGIAATVAAAWGLPVVAAAALPATGLHDAALTGFLSRALLVQILTILAVATALGLLGSLLQRTLLWPSGRWGLASVAASGAVLVLALFAGTGRDTDSEGDLFTAQLDEGRLPLIVLCIDGADPDDVILPLAAAGEMPTFARLLEEGTFAPLETMTPTLSPAVWTTLATGKRPEEHGILHFILFDLPLVSTPVSVFPLHTGLNFKIFPRLEQLPGMPALQAPYTSELRRAPAVWEIAGVHAPVGSYRWRVTWPVEEVNGFAVASDVSLLDQMPGFSESGVDTRERRVWPKDAYRETRRARRERPDEAEVARYITTPRSEIDLEDPQLRPVLSAYNRALPVRLTELIAKYRPALTLAGYHSVDGFSHRYWKDRRDGGRFSPAIEQRYRFVDEELGTTLAALEESLGAFNLIIVSDHGFDFSAGHHTLAPPGIFFGWGPAFEAGRRMKSLHVLDIAPLMLDLVGLPVADDMPGAEPIGGEPPFRAALSEEQRADHALRRTPSYGRRELRALSDTPFEEETLEKLRSLGYID